MTQRLLKGIGVSPGVAVGPAVVVRLEAPDVPHRVVPPDAVEGEVGRLNDAVGVVRSQLQRLRTRARERVGPEEAKIFDAQIMMLEDRDFLGEVEQLILENQLAAERAFEFKALEVRALWESSASRALRDKVVDLAAVQLRVLNELLGRPNAEDVQKGDRPVIVVTQELTPGLTVQFERDHVIGFVSEEGTRTAHAAILARSLGLPCIMGLPRALERIPAGSELVVDGTRGTVLISPSADEVAEARGLETRRVALLEDLDRVAHEPAATVEGVQVAVRGNLDLPDELDALARHGAEGVGLMRTEFLVVGRAALPDEDELTNYFRRVARQFPGLPVTVRSYDVGGDKFPAAFRISPEANPFLGWRALRVCLDRPEVFVTQLRALLRARTDGDVRLMLPLVIELDSPRLPTCPWVSWSRRRPPCPSRTSWCARWRSSASAPTTSRSTPSRWIGGTRASRSGSVHSIPPCCVSCGTCARWPALPTGRSRSVVKWRRSRSACFCSSGSGIAS